MTSIELTSRLGPAFFALRNIAPALSGDESQLFVAADAAMGVQAFENKFRGGGSHGIRLARAESQGAQLVHQALDAGKLLHHALRTDAFVQLQAAAQLE